MVVVKDGLRVIEIEVVLRHFIPWKVEQGVEVIGLNAVFTRLGIHALEFANFFVE